MSEETILLCPHCDGSNVLVVSEDSWFVNTGELFCHSVKTIDDDAKARCFDCEWRGKRKDLRDKPE